MHILEQQPGLQVKRGGGAFIMVINIADLMPVDIFKSKVDEWVRTIKNGKLQKGFDEILLPGERAWRERQKRLQDGIPVQPSYWQGIKNMAAEAGVDIESLR